MFGVRGKTLEGVFKGLLEGLSKVIEALAEACEVLVRLTSDFDYSKGDRKNYDFCFFLDAGLKISRSFLCFPLLSEPEQV